MITKVGNYHDVYIVKIPDESINLTQLEIFDNFIYNETNEIEYISFSVKPGIYSGVCILSKHPEVLSIEEFFQKCSDEFKWYLIFNMEFLSDYSKYQQVIFEILANGPSDPRYKSVFTYEP